MLGSIDSDSPYHKLFLHYSIGVGKIHNEQEIEKERQQFYFKREYELNYSVAIGNIFTEPEVSDCEELGRHYTKFYEEQHGSKDYINLSTQKSLGIDWGFGSSKTAFVVTEFVDGGYCRVIYANGRIAYLFFKRFITIASTLTPSLIWLPTSCR
jgi:hypothetical protein